MQAFTLLLYKFALWRVPVGSCRVNLSSCRDCIHDASCCSLAPTIERPTAVTSLGGWPHHPYLFPSCPGNWLLFKEVCQHGTGFLPRRTPDDGVDRRTQFPRGQSWVTGADGMVRFRIPIRNSCRPLALDRRHSRDAVSGHCDDAFLLRLQDALCTRLSQVAVRRAVPPAARHYFWRDDGIDERREHLLHGPGDESGAGLEHSFQHLGIIDHRCGVRGARRPSLRDL